MLEHLIERSGKSVPAKLGLNILLPQIGHALYQSQPHFDNFWDSVILYNACRAANLKPWFSLAVGSGLALLSEIGQKVGIIPGTYSAKDMGYMAAGALASYITTKALASLGPINRTLSH